MTFHLRRFILNLFFFGGLLTSVIVILSISTAQQAFTMLHLLGGIVLWGLFFFIGIALTWSKPVSRRRVNTPVDPERLEHGQICYLDGRTKVIFLEIHEVTGRYGFNHPKEGLFALRPEHVALYVSHNKEVD